MADPDDPGRWRVRCLPPKGLVRPVRVDPAGLSGPTPNQARGPRWRTTSPGRFVPAAVDGARVEQRILEQSVRLPAHGAVTGWAALRMLGAAYFDGHDPRRYGRDGGVLPVPLVVGPDGRLADRPGSTVLRDRLDPTEVRRVSGVPCTAPVRAVFDAARMAPDLREAVVAIDMAAAADLVSLTELHRYLVARAGWRGVPQVRAALALASERSASPQETRMRLVWVLDAGLPQPGVNVPLFGPGGALLGIADLLDEEAGVLGEFDGAAHLGVRRRASDLARDDRCAAANLTTFRVTGPDLRDVDLLRTRMRRARERGLARDRSRDTWTTRQPDWYREEPGLDERRAFNAWLVGEQGA